MRVSIIQRLLDVIAPRSCVVCGRRLAPEEQLICLSCNLHLPRTHHVLDPYDNDLARTFWGRIDRFERAAALFYHYGGAQSSYPIYQLKYFHSPEIGVDLGRLMAQEMQQHGFFDGVDALIPVPLSTDRQRERGYNQSQLIAEGMSEVCHLPVLPKVVARKAYHGSQTTHERWGRLANVEHAFALLRPEPIAHRHVLLVDDIVTTGATICACAKELSQADEVRISVAAVAFADPRK